MKKNKSIFKLLGSKFTYRVILITFIAQMISFACITLFFVVMFGFLGWKFEGEPQQGRTLSFIIFGGIVSIIAGLLFTAMLTNRFLKPINDLKEVTNKVSKGDFTARIEYQYPEGEISELIKKFNLMIEELDKNKMLKNDFISNVSHEFKTPLSTIQGYASLLQDTSLSKEEIQKYTSIIIESTTKLTTLISDILKISKLDNSNIQVETELYSLDEQIRETILLFENKWSKKNLDLNINLDSVMIESDKSLLGNVWNNLVSNAIKFSRENGKLSIFLEENNDLIKVSIEDTGCGIAPEHLPYIFDKFYQEDKSHSIEGNGLGLALTKRIVDLLKGKIEVESKVGEGTTFTIYLPLKID